MRGQSFSLRWQKKETKRQSRGKKGEVDVTPYILHFKMLRFEFSHFKSTFIQCIQQPTERGKEGRIYKQGIKLHLYKNRFPPPPQCFYFTF